METSQSRKEIYKAMLKGRDSYNNYVYGLNLSIEGFCEALNMVGWNKNWLTDLLELQAFNPSLDFNEKGYPVYPVTAYWYSSKTTDTYVCSKENQIARDLALEFAILFCDEPDILKPNEP